MESVFRGLFPLWFLVSPKLWLHFVWVFYLFWRNNWKLKCLACFVCFWKHFLEQTFKSLWDFTSEYEKVKKKNFCVQIHKFGILHTRHITFFEIFSGNIKKAVKFQKLCQKCSLEKFGFWSKVGIFASGICAFSKIPAICVQKKLEI